MTERVKDRDRDKERDRQTELDTDRQTETESERDREGQTDRQTDRVLEFCRPVNRISMVTSGQSTFFYTGSKHNHRITSEMLVTAFGLSTDAQYSHR